MKPKDWGKLKNCERDNVECFDGDCETCGWSKEEEQRRVARIRAGDMAPMGTRIMHLVLRPGKEEQDAPER